MIASTILFVPTAKLGFSATPTVPFHNKVCDEDIISENSFIDFSPISSQIIFSGISLASETFMLPEPNESSSPVKSIGSKILVPFFEAFFNKFFATSTLSFSAKEMPIFLFIASKNVFAIAPPIIILSARSKKFSITVIFVSIFDPPMINESGFKGFESFSERNFISCSIRRPIPFVAKCFVIPEFEAWSL